MTAFAVSILVLVAVALYFYLAYWVGEAAAAKGRSKTAWTAIAFCFGLVVPAIIVACWAPVPLRR